MINKNNNSNKTPKQPQLDSSTSTTSTTSTSLSSKTTTICSKEYHKQQLISLCLMDDEQHHRVVIQLFSSCSLANLYQQAYDIFEPYFQSSIQAHCSNNSMQLWTGFPLRPLVVTMIPPINASSGSTGRDNEPLSSSSTTAASTATLDSVGIKNQDRIVVRFVDMGTSIMDVGNRMDSMNTTCSNSPPKRAAARKAQESWNNDLLLQQQQQQEQQQDQQKETKNRKRKQSVAAVIVNKKPSTSAAAATKRMAHLPGYRLGTSETNSASNVGFSQSNLKGKHHQQTSKSTAVSRISIARSPKGEKDNSNLAIDSSVLALMGAVQGRNSQEGTMLRKGWKQAVENAYEQNKAVARLAAATSMDIPHTIIRLDYGFHPKDNNDLSATIPQNIVTTYARGVQGHGEYTEVVDYIPLDVLVSVIEAIHPANREALRPENLAALSPRVYWNLLYHYHHKSLNEQQQQQHDSIMALITIPKNTTDLGQILKDICPLLDWTFLRRRKQQLSAKAIENLRQQQSTLSDNDSINYDYNAAAAAIESVEHAMSNLTQHDKQSRARLLANAAQQRFVSSISWQIQTPMEPDIDELIECVQSYYSSRDNKEHSVRLEMDVNPSMDNGDDDDDGAEIIAIAKYLMEGCCIPNWRVLANCTTDDLINRMELYISQSAHVTTAGSIDLLSAINNWIEFAQLQSLEEIMVEICDGSTEAVELLREYGQSGTPKDLSMWRSIIDSLYDVLIQQQQEHYQQQHPTGIVESPRVEAVGTVNENLASNIPFAEPQQYALPSKSDLHKWCHRSYLALQQLEWLNSYVTPV